MSFLTPLYLLAGLAVTLPILFHLIRRTPQGRQVFSSLMFLEPSPPKLTKRSRLENLLLLLLRGLAICFIALAFSRPFLRQQAKADETDSAGRRLAILLDRSASMQHGENWQQAIDSVSDLLDQVTAADSLAFLTFDRETQTIMSFEDWAELDSGIRKSTVMERLAELKPTHFATELGRAVILAADMLDQKTDRKVHDRRLYLISDLQDGCRWEALNGYQWPENVHAELRQITPDGNRTNASLHLIASDTLNDDAVRLRITNTELSQNESFQVGWADPFAELDPQTSQPIAADTIKIYVPPGQSKVFHAPERAANLPRERVVLTGDAVTFDNTCYVAVRKPWDVQIVFLGEEQETGQDSLRFFLAPVFPSTPTRTVTITAWNSDSDDSPIDEAKISLAIVGGKCSQSQLAWAKNWVKAGGKLIFVAVDAEQALELYEILEMTPRAVTNGDVTDYLMLNSVDLSHPVFAPFNDPRFADFSKLRFYEYRAFDTESFPEFQALATFEGGQPAITEIPLGEGRVVLFSAGWRRQESDFAVWSKFVPMMNGLLEYLGSRTDNRPQFYVGDSATRSDLGLPVDSFWLKRGEQPEQEIAGDESYLFDAPGVYTIANSKEDLSNPEALRVSVNLHPDESRTNPLSPDTLIAAGLPIDQPQTSQPTDHDPALTGRQMMNRELEERQQGWKWLLLGALGILILETIIASFQQRPHTIAS